MVKQLLFILLMLPFLGFSQNNKELRELLNLPQSECEEVSPILADSISKLQFGDEDSFAPLLENWILQCGYNEAVFRIFVLMSIQKGSVKEQDLGPDFEYYINNFQDRAKDARLSNHKKIFERDKEYFLYIPLNSTFDKWTSSWADSLLNKPDISELDYFFLSLYANKEVNYVRKHLDDERFSSIDFINKRRTKYEKEIRESGSVSILIGSWTPTGNVSNFVGTSPLIGLTIGALVTDKWSIEGGGFARIPINLKDFRINTLDSTEFTHNTFSISLNVYGSYDFIEYKNFRLNPIGGLGAEFFLTDIDRPIQSEDEDPGNYSITTYNLQVGLDASFRTHNFGYWGLKSFYTVMNYNNGIRAVDDLSGNAVSFLLYYKF